MKGEYAEFYRKSYLYYQDGTRHLDLWFYRRPSDREPLQVQGPLGANIGHIGMMNLLGLEMIPTLIQVGEPYRYLDYKVRIYASDLETLGASK